MFRLLLFFSLLPLALTLIARWWFGTRVLASCGKRMCRCDLKLWTPVPGERPEIRQLARAFAPLWHRRATTGRCRGGARGDRRKNPRARSHCDFHRRRRTLRRVGNSCTSTRAHCDRKMLETRPRSARVFIIRRRRGHRPLRQSARMGACYATSPSHAAKTLKSCSTQPKARAFCITLEPSPQ